MTTALAVLRTLRPVTARPAPLRAARGLGDALRTLLVGPEPAETLLGRGATLLHPAAWRAVTAAGAVVLLVVGVADWVQLARNPSGAYPPLSLGLAVAHTVPVALAVHHPLLAWRISALATVLTPAVAGVEALGGSAGGSPWPPLVGVLHLLVLAQLAATVPRAVAGAAALVDGAALLLLVTRSAEPSDVQEGLALIALVTFLGASAGAWGTTSGRLAEQRRRIAEEQSRRAVLEERARIARELHDVVAHHLSLIAVRAESAPHRVPELRGPAAVTELDGLAAAARAALVEMRRLLGVLRSADEQAERAPQPQLADLDELVAAARRSGLRVRLSAEGAAAGVPAAVGLVLYRLVQEALSNASRHAPGSAVCVGLRHADGATRVRVVNTPPSAPGPEPAARGGQGLIGMRERVGMLGGHLDAGPVAGGGYAVDATLPWHEHARVERES